MSQNDTLTRPEYGEAPVSTQWNTIKPTDIVSGEEAHALRQRSDLMGAWLMLHCWGVIIGSAALYALLPNVLTFLVAVILIGGRQLGLAILMHEASHGMLFKTRSLNERIGQWFAGWPIFINIHVYRKRHMAHHRFTRTDRDPENYLYTPFPVRPGSMARKIARDLLGIVFLRTQAGIFRFVWGEKAGRAGRLWGFYAGPVAFNIGLAAIAASFGRPDLYLLMWVLPLMTTQQLVLRIRNIAEHATVPDLDDPLRNSRTTKANIFERMTFAPYWVNFHIEHHLMPFVPCYRLKALHDIMVRRGYADRMEIRDGYVDIIRINASA